MLYSLRSIRRVKSATPTERESLQPSPASLASSRERAGGAGKNPGVERRRGEGGMGVQQPPCDTFGGLHAPTGSTLLLPCSSMRPHRRLTRPAPSLHRLDPVQVTQMAKYLETVYVSGWQCSSTASSSNEPGPDLAGKSSLSLSLDSSRAARLTFPAQFT